MTIDDVIEESERFLREEVGAQRCRAMDVLSFANIVWENGLNDNVQVRDFTLDLIRHTQAYVELNGEYIYSTLLL